MCVDRDNELMTGAKKREREKEKEKVNKPVYSVPVSRTSQESLYKVGENRKE